MSDIPLTIVFGMYLGVHVTNARATKDTFQPLIDQLNYLSLDYKSER